MNLVPEMVFYIITEDPKVKHVTSQVNPAGMHEHQREDCQKNSDGISNATSVKMAENKRADPELEISK
jgi:hypothetical protein